jgi:hypothetical protein
MHQPPSNIDHLLETDEWAAKEILFAYDRMPRALWGYEDLARVNVIMSGTLLETLSHPDFQRRAYGIVDCGSLLWALQNTRIFEQLGTAYYHPVLPLIPQNDWDEQIRRWQSMGRHIFARDHFAGFWPPELGFDMKLIPHLVEAGYEYVIVDSEYVDPVDDMDWHELRYRPHIAEHDGAQIVVVVRDRDLSNAQLAGMDYGWFYHELHERTKSCDFPPLVTTATDGDNGGWFRNVHPKGNFWAYFYKEALDEIRAGNSSMRPTFISDYLRRFGAEGRVEVRRGAWNTDKHHGWDFHQWMGSQTQRDGMARVHQMSQDLHTLYWEAAAGPDGRDPSLLHLIDEARWRLLRAQTSCNFYWGEAWVGRAHVDLDGAAAHLAEVKGRLRERTRNQTVHRSREKSESRVKETTRETVASEVSKNQPPKAKARAGKSAKGTKSTKSTRKPRAPKKAPLAEPPLLRRDADSCR